MTLEPGKQIIKTRDDPGPVRMQRAPEAPDPQKPLELASGASCSWAKAGEPFGSERLRPRIEPWLTALVQSEHLSLLVGSGLTHAVHNIAKGEVAPGMSTVPFAAYNDEISADAKRSARAAGRENGNIEDQIRAANELLRGLEILVATKPRNAG